MTRRRFKLLAAVAMILAAALCLCCCGSVTGSLSPAASSDEQQIGYIAKLEIIDVGQGSGALLQAFGEGKTVSVLIDAGEKTASQAVCDALDKAKVKKLDLAIVTHPHTDHLGGMIEVLKGYEVGELWMPDVPEALTPTNSTYDAFLTALEQNGCPVVIKTEPQTLTLTDDVTLKLLNAFIAGPQELNNTSLCVRIDAKEASFLITGDAEVEQEDQMRLSGEDIDADIFVAGHHGSNSSSKQYFLNAVSPLASVISVGRNNDYNLPSAKAVKRLAEFGEIYRTDINKNISFFTDGETITVAAEGINDTISARG